MGLVVTESTLATIVLTLTTIVVVIIDLIAASVTKRKGSVELSRKVS